MDKFDKLISKSKHDYKPSKDFVDKVMQRIDADETVVRHRFSLSKLTVFASSVAVIAVLVLVGFKLSNQNNPVTPVKTTANNETTPSNSTTSPSSSSTTQSVIAPSSADDNATLSSDLNTVGGQLSQENQDLSSSNNAINDQQQEIAVPTD